MKIVFIGIVVVFLLIIAFVITGIAVNKHNMNKDKYDLLDRLKKNKDNLSITLKEDGRETISINSNKKYPLASTLKIIIAFNFVKYASDNKISITDTVKLDELERFYIPNTDGGAHPKWKKSIGYPAEISLLEVAKGMMQFSSNACTDYLINKIGVDVINQSIEALDLNHDKIFYLTPPVLIPGYLSDKINSSITRLESMDKQTYRKLSYITQTPLKDIGVTFCKKGLYSTPVIEYLSSYFRRDYWATNHMMFTGDLENTPYVFEKG